MSFQHWEIPGGQEGEGRNLRRALDNAIGTAIARDLIDVSYLATGWGYDLSVPEVNQQTGLAVVSDDLAVLVAMPWLPRSAWVENPDSLPPEAWPRVAVMPEVPSHTVYRANMDPLTGKVEAVVYKVVRHIESTPDWTDWLLKRHEL